ncbi:hypothetical protein [Vibrio hepatarius]|uniref:hypothetical protein n=1 Tax=Vibrio hepatarius TaxID=171383 RepID=UPI001C090AA8|nr:hypothetical protein [Vibrio hepatarius]MBU2898295.1 hypothetical protein [Vibrio hepatarius]
MKKIFVVLLLILINFSSESASSSISVTPMFLKIASGGSGSVLISNSSEREIELKLKVTDMTSLQSKFCSIGSDHLIVKAREEKVVTVQCLSNRDRELHLLEIDLSEFQKREVRRVVLY